MRPCPRMLQAIEGFPTPRNLTDVRSWLGLLNQVSYAFASADYMQPYRDLLKPGQAFTWTDELDLLFRQSKKRHHQPDQGRRRDLRQDAPHMPGYRRVKGRHGVLAPTKALPVRRNSAILLSFWLAYRAGWESLHPRC